MNLRGRWSRQVLLVVAAAVLLGVATVVGGRGSPEVPGDVSRAFQSAVAAQQADAVAPLEGGADRVDYTSYRSTSSVADLEATLRLWSDDGSGRAGRTVTVTATLERDEDGWRVAELDGLQDPRTDAQ